MTVQTLDDETIRLWKDPDTRWGLDQGEHPVHPSGEITFDQSGIAPGPTWQMLGIVEPAYAWTFVPFGAPSVSCLGGEPTTDDLG
jgi:hypothetical protein